MDFMRGPLPSPKDIHNEDDILRIYTFGIGLIGLGLSNVLVIWNKLFNLIGRRFIEAISYEDDFE